MFRLTASRVSNLSVFVANSRSHAPVSPVPSKIPYGGFSLTVQHLKVQHRLGRSLSNTNLIESCFAKAAHWTRRVKRWDGPRMILRWTASALLSAEKKFKRINGAEHLKDLEKVLRDLQNNSTLKAA